jgi:hypothetical protein
MLITFTSNTSIPLHMTSTRRLILHCMSEDEKSGLIVVFVCTMQFEVMVNHSMKNRSTIRGCLTDSKLSF